MQKPEAVPPERRDLPSGKNLRREWLHFLQAAETSDMGSVTTVRITVAKTGCRGGTQVENQTLRGRLDAYVGAQYGVVPEVLPFSHEEYEIYRHVDTGKWFAVFIVSADTWMRAIGRRARRSKTKRHP